jgi:small subunit ribosomal protein S6
MEQVMREYELVYIVVPTLEEPALTALTERVTGWITEANGTVSGTRLWGRQRLAYAIKKQTEGVYVQVNFQLAPSACRELDRNLKLDEQIIRHLVVRPNED